MPVLVNDSTPATLDKTFTLNLSNATGAGVSLGRAAGTGTIWNSNAAAFSINDVGLAADLNGTTAFVFQVTLAVPSNAPVSVQVDTADGTASVADGDYQPISGLVLTFNPGDPLTQTVTVLVNGDPAPEATETFTINLSNPTGPHASLARAMGIGTILNPFVVITTADDGPGSLRDAILAANDHPGLDVISFNIPGPGVQTISVGSPLPTVTDPVIIDGYTQPGASPNTLAQGDNAVLLIDLAAQNVSSSGVLTISAGNSTVRGLVINRTGFGATAIALTGNGGNHVEGNFLGTDAAGAVGLGVGLTGPVTVVPDSRADAPL